MSSLLGGFVHPLTVPAHALALLALGLLIGRQDRGERAIPSAAFVAALAAGLAAIAGGVGQTSAGDVLLVAAAAAGFLVALAKPLPALAAAPIAAAAGLALGLDSPPAAISIAAGVAALIGTGFGACLALALVVACVRRLTTAWQRIGARILGSWIAASTILVLALRFARGQLF